MQQRLEIAGLTDVGRVRQQNEDAIGWEQAIGLVLLADGVGGRAAGEVASRMAIDTITTSLRAGLVPEQTPGAETGHDPGVPALVQAAVRHANAAIYDSKRQVPEYQGMATTVVVALFEPNRVTVSHAGDSRLYRMRGDAFVQLTEDHTLVRELVLSGYMTEQEAAVSGHRHIITRALGVGAEIPVEVQQHQSCPGDLYLLCSDGLTSMLSDQDIATNIGRTGQGLPALARQLVDLANAQGGYDNVSVVLVRVP